MVFKSHLYTYANNSIYRIEDVANPSSTGLEKTVDNNIHVYPNPASSQLNIKFGKSDNKNGNWEIINIYGQVMMNGILQSGGHHNHFSIKTGQLPDGYYLLKVNTEGIITVTNFLKK